MRFAMFLLLLILPSCSSDTPGVTGPETPAEVSVTVATVEVRAYYARIVWTVAPARLEACAIQRRHGTDPWKDLTDLPVDPLGRVVLEDLSVQPGEPYAFRVRLGTTLDPRYLGEVGIVVPR